MPTHNKPYSIAGSQPLSGSELTAINQFARANLLAIVEQLLPGGNVIGKEYIPESEARRQTPGQFQDLHVRLEGRHLERLRHGRQGR